MSNDKSTVAGANSNVKVFTGNAGDIGPRVMVKKEKLKLFSIDEVLRLPNPEYLVHKLLESSALGVLYGPPNAGKSFVALDLALCVATGLPWHGHRVKQGRVVYIAAEGQSGIKKRVQAWMDNNGVRHIEDAFIVLEPLQVTEKADRDILLQRLNGVNAVPTLIVFDTFARCFVGGDENSSQEVGKFVNDIQGLQEALQGATALVVHHTVKASANAVYGAPKAERGSSALRGAAASMFQLEVRGKALVLTADKQKDDPHGGETWLRLTPVVVGVNNGEDITSCIVEDAREEDKQKAGRAEKGHSGSEGLGVGPKTLYDILAAQSDGLSSTDWRKAFDKKSGTVVKKKTFDNWRVDLVKKRGLVEEAPEGSSHYRVTSASAMALPKAS